MKIIKKNKIIFCLFIFITFFMSIVYAKIVDVNFSVNGDVSAQVQDGIFIQSVNYNADLSKNVDVNQSSNVSSKTFLNSNIELSATELDSKLTYDITIYNNSDYDISFDQIISEENLQMQTNNNEYIEYTYSINYGDILKKGNEITFTLTFKYKDSLEKLPDDQNFNKLNSHLSFAFKDIYTIVYLLDIADAKLPETIIEGENLVIDFNEFTLPVAIFVKMGDQDLELMIDYKYENGILEIENVTGNLMLTTFFDIVEGYKRLTYIESNGTQYIDTGIIGKSGVSSEIGMSVIQGGDYSILGSRLNSQRIYLSHIYGGHTLGYGVYYSCGNLTLNKYGVLKTILKAGNQKMSLDDQEIYSSDDPTVIDTGLNLYAFKLNHNNSAVGGSYVKIYYMKIWEEQNGEDILVRDYVPAYEETSGKVGLYDLIENKFYYNKGSGEFLAEFETEEDIIIPMPDIPSEYQKLQYLQSSGGQYIDTGIARKSGLSSEIHAKIMQTGDYSIVGGRNEYGRIYLLHWAVSAGIGYGNYWMASNVTEDFEYHKYNTVLKNGKQTFAIDDVEVINQTHEGDIDTQTNLTVFDSISRIYYMKLWEEQNGEDVLVREFVPCYRKSDKVYGMYDVVNDVFYTNAGTGTFTGKE